MSKAKKSKVASNQKYIIIAAAIALAAVGYYSYRSMAVSPDINMIVGGDGGTMGKRANSLQKAIKDGKLGIARDKVNTQNARTR